jgi:hypothetical protein
MNTLKISEFIATTLSIVGGICTVSLHDSTRATGFGIWIISNIFWVYNAYKTKSWGIAITFSFYSVINVVGMLSNNHIIKLWW